MWLMLLLSVFFGGYFYVESFKNALPAKKWALIGVTLGPMAFPMFAISKHVAIRHAQGFKNTFLNI